MQAPVVTIRHARSRHAFPGRSRSYTHARFCHARSRHVFPGPFPFLRDLPPCPFRPLPVPTRMPAPFSAMALPFLHARPCPFSSCPLPVPTRTPAPVPPWLSRFPTRTPAPVPPWPFQFPYTPCPGLYRHGRSRFPTRTPAPPWPSSSYTHAHSVVAIQFLHARPFRRGRSSSYTPCPLPPRHGRSLPATAATAASPPAANPTPNRQKTLLLFLRPMSSEKPDGLDTV